MKVAVVGGGVSGIRAALTLARAGVAVAIYEKNRHLGGRVFSFTDSAFGEIDIGQHIWLRGCTAVEELLRDLEVPDDWVYRQDRVAMTYRWNDGTSRLLAANGLPGQLSFLPILLGSRLSLRDKFRYALGVRRARGCTDLELEKLDEVPFTEWLKENRQPQAAIDIFWQPFVVGVCNGQLAEISARHALFAVREAFLKSPRSAAICLLRCPLSAVYDRRAREVLERAGVQVRTGVQVREVRPGTPVVVHSSDGTEAEHDRVILALPLKYSHELLAGHQLPAPPGEGAIIGLLLRYAAPVMDELFFTAVGGPVQIVFNKTAIWQKQEPDGSQVIELVTSAAEREKKLGVEALAAEQLPALARLLPRVRATPLLAKRMLVHATATFRVPPGGERKRLPFARPELQNVIFAGDYAATGWPSTMESAVRAGRIAAELALE